MPRRLPPARFAALLLLTGTAAWAAPKLPAEADQALTKAERALGRTQGDERIVACIDAIQPLEIVVRAAPDYAYPVGLLAECHFLNDGWDAAITHYTTWLTLVPPEARVGPVLEKVQKAIQRLRIAYMKTGRALSELPTPKGPVDPPPVETPKPVEPKVAPPKVAPPKPVETKAVEPKAAPVDDPPPPVPEPEPEPLPDAAVEPPPALQIALRAGYSPLAGVVGAGLEARWNAVHLAVGSGAMPLAAGAGVSFAVGPGRAYAEAHAVWIDSSFLTERVTPRRAYGATVGYDLRPLPFLSLKLGVGGAYEELAGRPWLLAFDVAAGPVIGF